MISCASTLTNGYLVSPSPVLNSAPLLGLFIKSFLTEAKERSDIIGVLSFPQRWPLPLRSESILARFYMNPEHTCDDEPP